MPLAKTGICTCFNADKCNGFKTFKWFYNL